MVGIFLQLFERVPADALVRFLSDVGTVSDAFSVMRAMPAWPFIKEAMRRGFTSPVEVPSRFKGSRNGLFLERILNIRNNYQRL